MRDVLAITLGVLACGCLGATAAEDILIADFEGKDYGAWRVEGTAFGPGPAQGTLPGQMPVTGFLGKGLVNSFYGGDRSTGTLTSPPFRVERRYINFLIGGGKDPERLALRLVVEGQVVRSATGPNERPGGSEALSWESWDVGEFLGKEATLVIVDQATGGWGHINVDQIVQSDTRRQEDPAQRELVIERNTLHLPVKNGARMRRMRLTVGGQVAREFDIELAEDAPDFQVALDVAAFKGQRVRLEVDRLPTGSQVLEAIPQADAFPDAERIYQEKYRPQFHFTSRRGWLNDPNGLVYYQGEYHLFYQHNPYGWKWGNMHWGHAVSPDLVHWRELPIALFPRQYGDWVFSGSAVVDAGNSAGFRQGDEAPIVAAFTSTGRGEAIVYSNDRGRTFTEYEGNPVVKHRGRDPRLLWYAPGRHWVMAVYDEVEKERYIAFYTSPDLKEWQFQSRIEGYYECPELFELPVDGKEEQRKWVVYGASGEYSLGTFDGKRFVTESGKHRFHYGNCFYASQTFSNIPATDGRRIQMAWGQMAFPGMPFNQMMNFPVELTLRSTEDGPRLFARPVREIEKLHARRHTWKALELREGESVLEGVTGDLFDIRAEFRVGQARAVGLSIRGIAVTYEVEGGQLSCGDKSAPLRPADGRIRLQVLVDRGSLEIFANDGRVYMPMGVIPPDGNRTLALTARGAGARVEALDVFELRSAWE